MLAAIVATFTLSSCSDINYSSEEYYIYYGDVIDDSHILLDNNRILEVVENESSASYLKAGYRLLINFSILEDLVDDETTTTDYKVRINAMSQILTKDVLIEADLTEDELEELGDDEIHINDTWISMSKYLNISFTMLLNDETHLINGLVTEQEDNNVVIELKHNAYEDRESYSSKGVVSLRVADLLPAEYDKLYIELRWKNYDKDEKVTDLILSRSSTSTTEAFSTISPSSVQGLSSYMIY